jgi:hypothetical protein
MALNEKLNWLVSATTNVTAFSSGKGHGSNPWKNKIHQDAVDAYKHFHSMMKAKGYGHKSYRQSAAEEHVYTHPKTGKSISIDGWHGTGKWGTHKSIHSLYDKTAPDHLKGISSITHEKDDYSPIHEIKAEHLIDPGEKEYLYHKNNINKIKDYLSKYA